MELRIKQLENCIQLCTKCKISEDSVNIYCKETGCGKLPIKIGKNGCLIVGVNPSIKRFPDTIEKGAFYGRTSGDILTTGLKDAGFDKEDFFITNLVKCSTPDNRALTKEETLSCAPFLIEEIETIRPKVILTLGVEPMNFFDGNFFRVRNWCHKEIKYMIFCLPHPGYLKYRPDLKKEFTDQLKKLKDLL